MTQVAKRTWALLFIISLALNLFLGGMLTARRMMSHPPPGDMRPFSLVRIRKALGPEAHSAVQNVLQQHGDGVASRMRAAADARHRAHEALIAEPFEPARAEAALLDFRTHSGHAQQATHEALVALAAQLTPEQRRRLAQGLDMPGGRGMGYPGRMGPGKGRRGGPPWVNGGDAAPGE